MTVSPSGDPSRAGQNSPENGSSDPKRSALPPETRQRPGRTPSKGGYVEALHPPEEGMAPIGESGVLPPTLSRLPNLDPKRAAKKNSDLTAEPSFQAIAEANRDALESPFSAQDPGEPPQDSPTWEWETERLDPVGTAGPADNDAPAITAPAAATNESPLASGYEQASVPAAAARTEAADRRTPPPRQVDPTAPDGRHWMERFGSQSLVLVVLLMIAATALVTGSQDEDAAPSIDQGASSTEPDGELVGIPESPGRAETPVPPVPPVPPETAEPARPRSPSFAAPSFAGNGQESIGSRGEPSDTADEVKIASGSHASPPAETNSSGPLAAPRANSETTGRETPASDGELPAESPAASFAGPEPSGIRPVSDRGAQSSVPAADDGPEMTAPSETGLKRYRLSKTPFGIDDWSRYLPPPPSEPVAASEPPPASGSAAAMRPASAASLRQADVDGDGKPFDPAGGSANSQPAGFTLPPNASPASSHVNPRSTP